MKKVISIIIGLLCVCATYAISYASPYKGSVSRHSTHIVHSGMASMPTASMSSVNGGGLTAGRGISSNMSAMTAVHPIRGIYTSASAIRGGVTAEQAYGRMNAPKRAKKDDPLPTPGEDDPELPECGCKWVDNGNGTYTCSMCGYTWDELDGSCHCEDESGYCWCPIEWDWSVLAFLSLLSFAYIAYKKRQKMSNFVKTVF